MDLKPGKPESKTLKGASDVFCPNHYQVGFLLDALD